MGLVKCLVKFVMIEISRQTITAVVAHNYIISYN